MTDNNVAYGKLFLIPSSLGEEDINAVWPAAHHALINRLRYYIVENIRTARRFLKKTGYEGTFEEVTFYLLDKHTPEREQTDFLQAAKQGHDIGLLSEAGCPGIADPGQMIVDSAHHMNIPVHPLVGPSSILLALMASGMNGQQFCFHGYLPISKKERIKKIRELEEMSRQSGATQIFMETPFRNNAMMEDLIKSGRPDSKLCVAADLTMDSEYIKNQTIRKWASTQWPDLHKRPAIFLLMSA
ncbi:MAG: SAM-dependent methyltransferase [Bacteroidales bacterium]